jgi:SAM-dependent methyltransferase
VDRFVARVATFVDEQLDPPARILDAGAGDGELATLLSARGHDVVAIDLAPGAPHVGVGDVAAFRDEEPFDAIVFARSLHHLAEPERSLANATSLLRPGGRLFVDEFFWDEAGRPEAELIHDTLALLVATGHVRKPIEPALGGDQLAWWQARHRAMGVHTGAQMEAWLAAVGQVTWREHVPFVARYLAGYLDDTDADTDRIVDELQRTEARRVKARTLARIGRHLMVTIR